MSADGLGIGDAGGGEAVERGMRTWSPAVWWSKVRHRAAIGPSPMQTGHEPLAEQLHADRLGLGAAAAVVTDHFRQSIRPRRSMVRGASIPAPAPRLPVFQG